MEIIHLILGKANPERMNGVNRVVYNLATKQVEYDHHVEVWGITKKIKHNFPPRQFITRLYQSQKNPFSLDSRLIREIKDKQGKAIFHLHGGWIPAFATASKLLDSLQIPFILTPHGAYNTIAMQRSRWSKKLYHRIFESKLINRSQAIHCLGRSEVNGLKKMNPEADSHILRYGFEPQIHNHDRIERGEFILGFVGRIDIYTKGLDLILQALAQLKSRNLKIQFWIIGDGKDTTQLRKLISEYQIEDICKVNTVRKKKN